MDYGKCWTRRENENIDLNDAPILNTDDEYMVKGQTLTVMVKKIMLLLFLLLKE